MAESKSSLFSKSVQKHAGRAKEKLLQNLGKVDRTADEIFDEHLTNFNRQQTNANRLQKEFNNYIRCIRAAQAASKLLMETVSDVYELPWTGSESLHAQVQSIESLWADYSHKLGDQVLIPLNTYTAQFPEMKKKIEKRSRKLIDYDCQRHSFQSLQANSTKRRDDVKVTKGREQLEEARRTYEILNTELHDELPALHDSRILFLVTNLQTLFATEQVFHSETSKLFAELEAVVDKLASDSQRGSYTVKKLNGNLSSPSHSPNQLGSLAVANNNGGQLTNGSGSGNASPTAHSPTTLSHASPTAAAAAAAAAPVAPRSAQAGVSEGEEEDDDDDNQYQNAGFALQQQQQQQQQPKAIDNGLNSQNNNPSAQVAVSRSSVEAAAAAADVVVEAEYANGNVLVQNGRSSASGASSKEATPLVDQQTPATTAAVAATRSSSADVVATDSPAVLAVAKAGEATATTVDAPVAAATAATDSTTAELPPGALYRVRATYKYVKEDADELSFDVGDTILVCEYEDPEDQEEGWLMGTKEGTTEKGMFPANFTRPL